MNKSGSLLELGLDIHRDKFVVVAQYDHATDERNTRVKTDSRDGRALCLRLDRYLLATKTLWP